MVRNTFPLPRTDEALQAVHSNTWFSSFDLVQGYLQLTMEESEIKKTASRTSAMGLYEFTQMSFRSSNVGSSFCHLVEQYLGDQQFLTLLLYLSDMCIFAFIIDDVLHWIELVFNRLKQFNLKIKSIICHSLILVYPFWVMSCQPKNHFCSPRKGRESKKLALPENIKEVLFFLCLVSYYRQSVNQFSKKVQFIHELAGPTSNENKKKARTKKNTTTVIEPKPRIFEWIMKHQDVFDALKEELSTFPVPGYPN